MKFAFERGQLSDKYITSYCRGNWSSSIRYQKEEAGIYHPDNMRQDGVIDENLSRLYSMLYGAGPSGR